MSATAAHPRAELQHFLLTNFNVPLEQWTSDARGVPVLTEQWMEHRWRLFETFCLPSVRGQSTQQFRWLIRFAPSTADHHRQRFCRLTAEMPNVTPLWRAESFSAVIYRFLDPAAPLLLTTRFDNDDALQRNALARIQAAVGDAVPEFLNLPTGFRLVLPDGQVLQDTHPCNPFISLVERAPTTRLGWRVFPARVLGLLVRVQRSRRLQRASGPLHPLLQRLVHLLIGPPILTARIVSHLEAARVAPVRQLSPEPAWLRIAHERNASRKPVTGEPCSPTELEAAFGVRLPIRLGEGRIMPTGI